MKKLENKIINKIYRIETKRTFTQILGRAVFIILTILSAVFIFSIIMEILVEQQSFDLFNFLTDNFGIVNNHFFRNSRLFIQELPLPLVCIFISLVVLFTLLVYTFVKNFKIVKNKLVSIYKFWFK